MTFEQYVAGKTVALVGPAPTIGDQSAEIEAHDLVYRVNFVSGIPPEYGTRTDIFYMNRGIGITLLDDDKAAERALAEKATWWVYKTPMGHRPEGNYRRAHKSPILNPNAIAGALYDLVQFPIKHVTVYGTDLYAGGPARQYHGTYPNMSLHELQVRAEAILVHKPHEQRKVYRHCLATGKVTGDVRFLTAVYMPDEQYDRILDAWKAAAAPAEQPQPALT